MAGTTGLEPATSAVTGQRSNQLSYVPNCSISNLGTAFGTGGFAQILRVSLDPNLSLVGLLLPSI